MGKDLPARRSAYSLSEVRAAVERVVPLLEINRPAFKWPFEVGGLLGTIGEDGELVAYVRPTDEVIDL